MDMSKGMGWKPFFTTSIPRLVILKSKYFIQISEIYTELVLPCGNINDTQ